MANWNKKRSIIFNKPCTTTMIPLCIITIFSWWWAHILYRKKTEWKCPWWRHQMETFSALLALCAGNSLGPVKSPHKGQWRGALMFSLICVCINGRVNNRDAGDFRRYRAHYDVTVMRIPDFHIFLYWWCVHTQSYIFSHYRFQSHVKTTQVDQCHLKLDHSRLTQ